ncbi:MAG TPA: DNA mismatch repair protein [Polyangiaceae bacterium]|nr:DNA mismatch repair protein [Polyangiaceae bacterium]
MQPPDLLEPTPRLRLDDRLFSETLTFAFATGSSPEAFERVLKSYDAGPSSFDAELFARDLFVKDLVARCLCKSPQERDRHPLLQRPLLAVLTHPTCDLHTLEHRHQVLRALLAAPELGRGLEQCRAEIRYLFELFQGSERARHGGAVLRRLDILRALKATIEKLERAFVGAPDPLARVHRFASALQSSDAWAHLLSLLDYEGNLATVDLRVRLGHDGEIRSFAIQRVDENQKNPWYSSPWRRLLARFSLLFRGLSVRKSELLGRLVETVFDELQEAWLCLYQLMLDFELYAAALRFRALALGKGLQVSLPELHTLDAAPEAAGRPPNSRFERLFNPLLLLEAAAPVPCDVEHGARAITIVTGPNSGGKTRLLQAVGVTQLLAQAGLFVPASRASLAVRSGMFVSLVQQAEAEQSEGRLGTELLRMRRLFETLPYGGLAILDELCSGTNPTEGEEIFQLLIELLGELTPAAFISTHFLGLAAKLERERPVELTFLEVELSAAGRATYRFVPGVAKTSLARGVAERLGVTRESLRSLLDARRGEQAGPASSSERDSAPSSALSSPTAKGQTAS